MARMSVEDRRAALLDAAFQVIARHGVEGATTRRICAQAEMPLASFHYAFTSRDELLSSLIETAVPDDISEALEAIAPGADRAEAGGLDGLLANTRASMSIFIDMLKSDPNRFMATISLIIYAHNHPQLREASRRMYTELYGLAARAMESSAQVAGVSWTVPPAELAPFIIATAMSTALTQLSDAADDSVIDRIVDALIRELMTHVESD